MKLLYKGEEKHIIISCAFFFFFGSEVTDGTILARQMSYRSSGFLTFYFSGSDAVFRLMKY